MSDVASNIEAVRGRIADAAKGAGRDPDRVTLIGVSKRQPDERLFAAYEAGLRDFGENTVQELSRKAELFSERGWQVRWHFLGYLQRNKVNALLRAKVHRIHTVDRETLVDALAKRAPPEGLDVLAEINLGAEDQKAGVIPEALPGLLDSFAAHPELRLRGLMAIPPVDGREQHHFDTLRGLRDAHAGHAAMRAGDELSMGMSNDFEAAVAAGATWIRVGTRIFGPRPTKD